MRFSPLDQIQGNGLLWNSKPCPHKLGVWTGMKMDIHKKSSFLATVSYWLSFLLHLSFSFALSLLKSMQKGSAGITAVSSSSKSVIFFISDVMRSFYSTLEHTNNSSEFIEITGNGGENEWVVELDSASGATSSLPRESLFVLSHVAHLYRVNTK